VEVFGDCWNWDSGSYYFVYSQNDGVNWKWGNININFIREIR
jgi:hypothetical protein